MTHAAKALHPFPIICDFLIIVGASLFLYGWFGSRYVPVAFFGGSAVVYSLYLLVMAIRLLRDFSVSEPSDLDRMVVEMRKRGKAHQHRPHPCPIMDDPRKNPSRD